MISHTEAFLTDHLSEAIRFYCGINEFKWNRHATAPGPYACVSPVYGRSVKTREINGVALPKSCDVIQDSGAFADGPTQRVMPEAALERQYKHSIKYGYDNQVTHRASYDLLIDERWSSQGHRSKVRWSEDEAEFAVQETIHAAQYISRELDRSRGTSAILSVQGVTPGQYLRCAQKVVGLLQPGDIIGLGGWCICGKMPAQMMPVFRATMRKVLPFLASEQVTRVHLWGVCFDEALAYALLLCDEWGISLQTDSSAPQLRPVFGRWGYRGWSDLTYRRVPVETRGLDRARHVALTRAWLAGFRSVELYKQGCAVLKTLPNNTTGKRVLMQHKLELPACCPISKNPRPGSSITIRYRAQAQVLEIAGLLAYIHRFVGGLHDPEGTVLEIRDMEGMITRIAQECAQAVGVPVRVRADMVLLPQQRMNVVVRGYPESRSGNPLWLPSSQAEAHTA